MSLASGVTTWSATGVMPRSLSWARKLSCSLLPYAPLLVSIAMFFSLSLFTTYFASVASYTELGGLSRKMNLLPCWMIAFDWPDVISGIPAAVRAGNIASVFVLRHEPKTRS